MKRFGIHSRHNLFGTKQIHFKLTIFVQFNRNANLFTIEIVGFVAGALHPSVSLLDAGRFRFCTAVSDAAVNGVL